jgi:chemotaxis protein methyltransferase CheR
MLAMLLRRSGELAGAERHFRTAIELSEAQPQDSPIPMSDGEPAGAFAAAARKSLQALISMRTK